MRTIEGNLITLAEDGEFDIIVHGANCLNTMGSGIAKEIRARYPAAYAADEKTVKGDVTKLGNYTHCMSPPTIDHTFMIINAYTQYDYNRAGQKQDHFHYGALEVVLTKLAVNFPTARFGLPMIGMGLAGGDTTRIMPILEAFAARMALQGGSATLVVYKG